jgi:hypothetical protein
MPGGYYSVFCEPAIAFGTKVPRLLQLLAAGLEKAWLNKYS